MALVTSCMVLFAVGLFALVAAAAGHRILRLCALEFPSDAEHLLCSIGLGVIAIEVLLFFAQIPGHIPLGVAIVLAVTFLFALGDVLTTLARVYGIVWRAMRGSRTQKSLIAVCGVVLLVEGLAAMAPLSGSDALHYHFTAPLLTLRYGFHPNFFLSYSFFTGQSHLLVLAGLALGSEQFALGLLFLGGVLAATAGACLAHRWMDRTWAWLVALLFLVTPVVFWQISIAGTPDLWLAFFATTSVLVISRSGEMLRLHQAAVAGAFAGAAASTKYTGCFVAAGIAVAYLWEAKSVAKSFVFTIASSVAGIWPYARNFAWTGDPLFPFLLPHLSPERVNAFALASFLGDTGASEHHGFWQLVAFPLFATIDHAYLGFRQFFGPLVLSLAPLLILVVRNTPVWRSALCVWGVAAVGIGASTEMMRFLLPVMPIALASVIAGAAQLKHKGWLLAHYVTVASVCGSLMFGAAGLLANDRLALAGATGFTTSDAYRRDHAPEYEESQFIDQTLQNRDGDHKTLVFGCHVYYLRVPYLCADPSASWAIDPTRFHTPGQWERLFRDQRVRWVVRSPDYPLEVTGPLAALEAQGKLVPIARAELAGISGMRLSGDRRTHEVVILEVKD
jgi:hypothetical protein